MNKAIIKLMEYRNILINELLDLVKVEHYNLAFAIQIKIGAVDTCIEILEAN